MVCMWLINVDSDAAFFFLFFFLCCCCRQKLLQKGNGKLFPAAADKRQGCLNNNTVGVLPSGSIRSVHAINWHAQTDHSSCLLLLKSNLSLFFFVCLFFLLFFPLLICFNVFTKQAGNVARRNYVIVRISQRVRPKLRGQKG